MDSLTLIIFLLLLALAINANQPWIAFGIAIVVLIGLRPITLGILVLVGTGLMIWMKNQVEYWWVILGLLMVAAFLVQKGGETGPEMYTPEMLMGG